MGWFLLRQSIAFTFAKANANRTCGLIHAIFTVGFGLPLLHLLTKESFTFSSMSASLHQNALALAITSNLLCYFSVGYFLMDSYFLLRTPYLKHHIGAIFCYVFAAYHCSTTIVCGGVTIALFELGAI